MQREVRRMRRSRGVFGVLVTLIILHCGVALVCSQGYVGLETESQRTVEKDALRMAEEVLAANQAKLLSIPGVVGVGMGLAEQGNRPAIHVYVQTQVTGGTVPAAIPKQINNVPIRIIETDEIRAR
jgi:hypothetical protein